MDKEAIEKIHQEVKRRTDPYRYDDGKLHFWDLGDQIVKIMEELGYRKVTDEMLLSDEAVEMLCRELYLVWQEAKSTEAENWDDERWEDLPKKHQEEYRKTARRIIAQLDKIKGGGK